MNDPERVVAIDWSGNAQTGAQKKHIWTAAFSEDDPELFCGLTRDELCTKIIERFQNTRTVIGIDFAFSFPVSYFRDKCLSEVGALWQLAEEHGEKWLGTCPHPLWGKPGIKRTHSHHAEGFRQTDRAISVDGICPKSPFQIGGAGAVGTGSIRGMPILRRLRDAGFSVSPFDRPNLPLVIEIYPRILTGAVRKSNAAARAAYLAQPAYDSLSANVSYVAASSEDAFDAFLSAFKMWTHRKQFAQLLQASDPTELLEGCIWKPAQ